MKPNRFVYFVIFFVSSVSLKNVNCENGFSSEKNDKRKLKIAVILPLSNPLMLSKPYECSNMLLPDALQNVEAVFYALDLIERDDTLSQKYTLTIDILESCYLPSIEMGHLSNLLEQLQVEPSDSENATVGVIYAFDSGVRGLNYETIFASVDLFPHISYSGPPSQFDMSTMAPRYNDDFLAITSGHIFIADVMFEILKHFEWKYIAIFTSTWSDRNVEVGNFFEKRAKKLAESDKVCAANDFVLENMNDWLLKSNTTLAPKVDVIICYCYLSDIQTLNRQLRRHHKKYVVIAGNKDEDWTKEDDIEWTSDLGDLYYVTPMPKFNDKFYHHYISSSGQNDTKYDYLNKFRERYLQKAVYGNEEPPTAENMYRNSYKNNSKTAFNIIKSLYTMAHAFKRTLNATSQIERHHVVTMLRRVNFELFNEEVSFTRRRGLPKIEKFDIQKFQATSNISGNFVKVGEYVLEGDESDGTETDLKTGHVISRSDTVIRVQGNLTITDPNFQYAKDYPKQTCSEPCPEGHFKRNQSDQCCWECVGCGDFEILNNDATSCEKCQVGFMADQNNIACISVRLSSILPLPPKWTDGQNLISIGFSASAIIMAVIVLYVFIKYQDTPAVKSTTRELCYIMFSGIILVNITVLISSVTLSFETADVRVLPPIGFTMIYAALVVKTNRIARILVTSKHKFANMNPKYASLKAQLIITSTLIGIETLICLFSVKFQNPESEMENSDFIIKKYYLDSAFLIEIFAFVAILTLLCTYYAIKTRNLPENFNETKCIGFAMYTTLITETAFGLVYFTTDKKILAMNLCASINSLAILIFLFSPKLYIILWRPEKNTKVYFSPVASNIRSFMGNTSRSNPHRMSNQCHSLENKKPSTPDDSKEQVHDTIAKAIKHLNDILNKASATSEYLMTQKDDSGTQRTDGIWEKEYAEMIADVKSCYMELNRMQKNDP
ncbi:metabotropic glutamate receptor 1-like [Planococcus citri]|uniref:metabotropic glutamate receptor 1-like n=1 Tax=Planococcus citri TaxID=170843 RepID=UPI0031FA0A97